MNPIDPNKTVISGPPAGPMGGQTQAMATQPDLDRTAAMRTGPCLTARVIPGREATMANGPAREAFLVEFEAASEVLPGAGVMDARTPLNLCLVIDRSGSMEGPPLEYAKQACHYVVEMLGPNDVLSIVTFEEMVDVLMAPQRVTQKQPVKDGIARIQPGNTTNLYDGLSLACQQVAGQVEGGRATRLVVLTDGEPTAGIRDFAALVQHAGEIKARGITCTFLGFGPEYNEELLAAMAKKAGGNYYYIPRPELIPEVFRSELNKLMTVAAQNLRLEMRLARWVGLRAAMGQPAPPGARQFTLSLADLERGPVLQQVFDFEYANHPLGHYRVASGRLTYEDAGTGRTETIDLDLIQEFSADAAVYGRPVDPRVAQAAELAAASRSVEKTIMGLKAGQLSASGAAQELEKTQALLVRQGRAQEAQEVTLALRALQAGQTGEAEKTLMGAMVHLDQGKKPGA
jgi:Ca-activated chloride channel family protein